MTIPMQSFIPSFWNTHPAANSPPPTPYQQAKNLFNRGSWPIIGDQDAYYTNQGLLQLTDAVQKDMADIKAQLNQIQARLNVQA